MANVNIGDLATYRKRNYRVLSIVGDQVELQSVNGGVGNKTLDMFRFAAAADRGWLVR